MNYNKPNYSCFRMLILFLFPALVFAQKTERDYAFLIQQELGGEQEVKVPSGWVDLVTDEYAIEIKFANKWKQAVGQALWYGLNTNKKPGIVLIIKDRSQYKYAIQLQSTLDYAGVGEEVKVWRYPDDFKAVSVFPNALFGKSNDPALNQPRGEYWLNTNSHVRHNRSCSNFQNTKRGRICRNTEGRACGNCGGD